MNKFGVKLYQQNKTIENVASMAVYLVNNFMKHFEEKLSLIAIIQLEC